MRNPKHAYILVTISYSCNNTFISVEPITETTMLYTWDPKELTTVNGARLRSVTGCSCSHFLGPSSLREMFVHTFWVEAQSLVKPFYET